MSKKNISKISLWILIFSILSLVTVAMVAESYSSAKTPIFTYRMTIFAPAARRGRFGGRDFFDDSANIV